jgi:hypothetical protein
MAGTDARAARLASVHGEAARWVAEEIARIPALPYKELARYEDQAVHCEMQRAPPASC